jgi:glucose/arabinose dehydrogenase
MSIKFALSATTAFVGRTVRLPDRCCASSFLLMLLVGLITACSNPGAAADPPDAPNPGNTPGSNSTVNNRKLPYEISLPPGFEISIYADNVPNARSMVLSPSGTLFVGTRQEGKFYAILDQNQDYQADEVITLGQGMNMPNGVAFRDGALYVAEVNRILRYDNIESDLHNPPQPVTVNDSFPADNLHGWKFIRFGPDGLLYVPVGAPCNICEPDPDHYAMLARMQPDGAGLEVVARGIRNTVGFDWHPETGELWFTDNGRDQMGDNQPPDELNHAPEPGLHFGYPYCHGVDLPDPDFGQQRACDEFTPPAVKLGPHVAALGMRFYTGQMFPEEYHNQIFIAEHGSWNRSTPIGYRITLVRLENNRALDYEVFAEGWLRNGQAWGRPVDLLVLPDGSLLVSDDSAGAIYRISFTLN